MPTYAPEGDPSVTGNPSIFKHGVCTCATASVSKSDIVQRGEETLLEGLLWPDGTRHWEEVGSVDRESVHRKEQRYIGIASF